MKIHTLFTATPWVAAIIITGMLQGYAAVKIYEPYTFVTIVGDAHVGGNFTDGIGTKARLFDPQGLAIDSAGSLYVTEYSGCAIRKVTPDGTNWVVTSVAGLNAVHGSTDGTGQKARFFNPCYALVDGAGNIYVADQYNNTIRKITPVESGYMVTTVAGQAGIQGSKDGLAREARFKLPSGLAMDSAGSFYVTDSDNYTIRKMTPVGNDWVVTTLAGKVGQDASVDGTNNDARFGQPIGMAIDSAGNLYVADYSGHTIRKVTPVGTNWVVTTLAGKAGKAGNNDGIGGDARFNGPISVAVDSLGSIYVTEYDGNTIRKVTPMGTNWMVTTLAGKSGVGGSTDGTGSAALLDGPADVKVDSAGRLFVTDDRNNTLRMGFPPLTITTSGDSSALRTAISTSG